MSLCLASAAVGGSVAFCDRPPGSHGSADVHYDAELDCAWVTGSFSRPRRVTLGEAERREAEDAYWRNRRSADEAETGTEMTG